MKQLSLLASFVLLLGITQSSCDKCRGIACFTPPPAVQCQVLDKNGNDLLNPATASHFDTSKIQVFTIQNGQKTLVKQSYYPIQNKINIVCQGTWLMDDKVNQMQIQLDSTNIEMLGYTLVEQHEDCCTFFKYGKMTINEKVVENSKSFTIVK